MISKKTANISVNATDFSYFQAIIKMYDSELLEEFEKWNGIDDHPEKLMWLLSNTVFSTDNPWNDECSVEPRHLWKGYKTVKNSVSTCSFNFKKQYFCHYCNYKYRPRKPVKQVLCPKCRNIIKTNVLHFELTRHRNAWTKGYGPKVVERWRVNLKERTVELDNERYHRKNKDRC